MREEKILTKGMEVNYKITGEGKPLLLLHGWGSNSEKWQKVADLLAKNSLRVIVPDLPGFGKSDKPSTIWNYDEYCDFIGKFVLTLNLEKFYLLGHSFGGALAVKCSIKFPEKIEKLFLVSAACFRRKAVRKKIFYIIAKILKIFAFLPFYSSMRKGFYKFIVRKSDYPYTEGIMKKIYLKIIKEDLSDILSQIHIPSLIIWGKEDKITPIEEAYSVKDKIENSKLEIISGVGHDLNSKSPEKLSELIIREL